MEDISPIYILLAISYLFVCFIIASTAKGKGHKFGEVFIISVITSPLVGAILFSNDKKLQEEILEELRNLNKKPQ